MSSLLIRDKEELYKSARELLPAVFENRQTFDNWLQLCSSSEFEETALEMVAKKPELFWLNSIISGFDSYESEAAGRFIELKINGSAVYLHGRFRFSLSVIVENPAFYQLDKRTAQALTAAGLDFRNKIRHGWELVRAGDHIQDIKRAYSWLINKAQEERKSRRRDALKYDLETILKTGKAWRYNAGNFAPLMHAFSLYKITFNGKTIAK